MLTSPLARPIMMDLLIRGALFLGKHLEPRTCREALSMETCAYSRTFRGEVPESSLLWPAGLRILAYVDRRASRALTIASYLGLAEEDDMLLLAHDSDLHRP